MRAKRSRPKSETVLSGVVNTVEEAYGRTIPVSWLVLIPLLGLSAVGLLPIMLINAARGKGASADFGGGHSLKDLRKGPEVSVIPLLLETGEGRIVEVEVHGYVRSDRLLRNDRIEATLRPQRRKDLPPRAHVIVNRTTGQTITPHPNTVIWHLGISMILQAVIGLMILGLLLAAWFAGG
ncbi:MAG: hypothetical protein JXA67_05835 [Micromonosporaceae bacterium]|nr:hypothetical protein [Micromonosporaceae bacterium]